MFVFKILMAILLFGVIIFVHELGHFAVAKWCGVRVNEFALGMGPKILSFTKGETTYSLRLLPLGGFCAMEGEDDDSDDPRAFSHKKVWQRILVVAAGVVMNFALAYVVLVVALGFFSPVNSSNGKALYGTSTIIELSEDASSYQTGLRENDTITWINGRPVATTQDLFMFLQSDEDGVVDMTVRRDGKSVKLEGVTFDLIQYTPLGSVFYDTTTIASVSLPPVYQETALLVGDTITHVGETAVGSLQELQDALQSQSKGYTDITVMRGKETLTVSSVVCKSLLDVPSDSVFDGTTLLSDLSVNTVYFQTALQENDIVMKVNDEAVASAEELLTALQADEDGVSDLVVKRGEEELTLSDLHVMTDVAFDTTRYLRYDFVLLGVEPNVLNTITQAAKNEWSHATTVWWSLVDIVTGKYGLNEVAGPVGTVDIIGDMVEQAATNVTKDNIHSLLMLFSLICVNVGVMNLLPLPALDGGRLVFLVIELIIRRPVAKKFEGMVHFIGLAALLLFMLLITFNDVFRLITG